MRRKLFANTVKKRLFSGKVFFAFTLAEVLVTLAIIGTVALIMIGGVIPKIQNTVLSRQAQTAKIKFTKSMEQMALNEKIGPYYPSTEAFVAELGNYAKFAKVCDKDHLTECFGYNELKLQNGDIYLIENITDGEMFGKGKDDYNDFTGDTIGLVTVDGSPLILAWNKKCQELEPAVYKWKNNTNQTTSCVSMMMDVNGNKKPNTIEKDIVLFNATSFGASADSGCAISVPGTSICWGAPFTPTPPQSEAECNSIMSNYGISHCNGNGEDYWAGAVKACGGIQNMPDHRELTAFAAYIYQDRGHLANITDRGDNVNASTSDLKMNPTVLGHVSGSLHEGYTEQDRHWFTLWSRTENGASGAYNRHFTDTSTYYDNSYRGGQSLLAVCRVASRG